MSITRRHFLQVLGAGTAVPVKVMLRLHWKKFLMTISDSWEFQPGILFDDL